MKWLDDPNERKKEVGLLFFLEVWSLTKKTSCDDVKTVSPLQNRLYLAASSSLQERLQFSFPKFVFVVSCFGVTILPHGGSNCNGSFTL